MENIMRVDFISGCCNSNGELVKGTERPVCILYNKTIISTEEVHKLIENSVYEYDERIVVTTPKQADNLKGI